MRIERQTQTEIKIQINDKFSRRFSFGGSEPVQLMLGRVWSTWNVCSVVWSWIALKQKPV